MSESAIKVIDHFGSTKKTLELVVPTLQLTIRELINIRVHQEFTAAQLMYENHAGLPQKTEAELKKGTVTQFIWMVGGQILKTTWEEEANKAQIAFQDGRFFILIDDKQVEGLDTTILLKPDSTIQFIRLVPLIGG